MAQKLAEEIALFRYGVIADLLHLEPGSRGQSRILAEKVARTYQIPGTDRTRVAKAPRHRARTATADAGTVGMVCRPLRSRCPDKHMRAASCVASRPWPTCYGRRLKTFV